MQRVPLALHPFGARPPRATLPPLFLPALFADALSDPGRPPYRVLPALPPGHLCGAQPRSPGGAVDRQQALGPDRRGRRRRGGKSKRGPAQTGRELSRVSAGRTRLFVLVSQIFQDKTEIPSLFQTLQFNEAAPRADPTRQQRGDEILAQAFHRGHFLKPFSSFFRVILLFFFV